jgi:hypothetical protein
MTRDSRVKSESADPRAPALLDAVAIDESFG